MSPMQRHKSTVSNAHGNSHTAPPCDIILHGIPSTGPISLQGRATPKNFVSEFMHLLSTTVLVRPSTSARVPLPSIEIHYRGESIVARLHARLNRLHALDLPKRRWRHLPRHMTILTLPQNIHGDRLRRNTRGTYRIITRRNRPLLPRKHFRGGLHDAENGGESCGLRVSLGA